MTSKNYSPKSKMKPNLRFPQNPQLKKKHSRRKRRLTQTVCDIMETCIINQKNGVGVLTQTIHKTIECQLVVAFNHPLCFVEVYHTQVVINISLNFYC